MRPSCFAHERTHTASGVLTLESSNASGRSSASLNRLDVLDCGAARHRLEWAAFARPGVAVVEWAGDEIRGR